MLLRDDQNQFAGRGKHKAGPQKVPNPLAEKTGRFDSVHD